MPVTWEEVVRLYRAILRETGGEFGFISEGTLRFILDTLNGMRGDVFSKAAYVVHEIAVKHPLVNGNKRLALALGQALITREGHEVGLDVQETTKFMLAVARGEVSEKGIAEWFRSRSKKTG